MSVMLPVIYIKEYAIPQNAKAMTTPAQVSEISVISSRVSTSIGRISEYIIVKLK